RPTDDCPSAAELADGNDVVDRADATGRHDVANATSDERPQELEIRPPEQAIPFDRGDDEARDAEARQPASRFERRARPRRRVPAAAKRQATADVDRTYDAVRAVPLDPGRGEGGVLESRGAEHDSPRPNGNRGIHVPGRSQAAADLAGNRRTHRSNDI